MAYRRKSMSIEEEDAFLLTVDEIMDDITTQGCYDDMSETMERIRKIVTYNVPNGKQIRGRGVVAAYRALVDHVNLDRIKETYVLGWCIEIFLASYLVVDDIIESSETRRGRACWYLVEKIGDLAINDAFLLSSLVDIILDKYFFSKPYYIELVELFNDVTLKSFYGQCMDLKYSKKKALSEFTMDEYQKIVKYKTSLHSFHLPVACAMILAGRLDPDDRKSIQDLVLEMGLLFQVQDDYLDCFGDPSVTGKMGTDISENKCSWLIVKAYEKASSKQKKVLKLNYGRGTESSCQNEEKVKTIYTELELDEEYSKFENETYNSICDKIENLSERIPTTIFSETVDIIYMRNK